MLLNLKLGLILFAVALAFSTGTYFKGRYDGSAACDARHSAAQLEVTTKVRKTDAKIKRTAPNDYDKLAAIEWLQQHVRQ